MINQLAENCNKYFLSVVDNIIENSMNNGKLASDSISPIIYLYDAYTQPFTNIKLKHTTTGQIEEVIRLLKAKNSHGYDEISTKF